MKKKETNYKSCQTSQQTVPIKYLELDWEFQVFCQGGIYCFHLVTDRGWAEVFWAFVGQHRAKGHFCTVLDSTSWTCGVTCLGRHRGGGNTLQWRSSRRRCPGRRRRFCTCHHTPAPGSDQYLVMLYVDLHKSNHILYSIHIEVFVIEESKSSYKQLTRRKGGKWIKKQIVKACFQNCFDIWTKLYYVLEFCANYIKITTLILWPNIKCLQLILLCTWSWSAKENLWRCRGFII